MTQAGVYQQYKLSVVSGGKITLPRASNPSHSNKSTACLTPDLLNYIVPFNNQIKIYSTETRQCVKTLKFSNSPLLSEIFEKENAQLADISLKLSPEENDLTLLTNDGRIIILNYKGKLTSNPKILKLNLEEGESVSKVFENSDNSYKLLTSQAGSHGSVFTYKVYDLQINENSMETNLEYTLDDVILSSWSNNSKFIACLFQKGNRRHIQIYSLWDKQVVKEFSLESISATYHSAASPSSRYVSSMAIDSSGTQLALGFASGVVNVLNVSDLQGRLLKWHIDSVLSLGFTDDDAYLLSGGWEKVVSFWQLSTNLQQFLPRLPGIVVDCQSLGAGKFYSLALQMTQNLNSTDYQLILLNSADLTSKVSVNGPLPVFNSPVDIGSMPVSAVSTKASTTVSTSSVSKKKQKNKLKKGTRQDFTTTADVNPVTKQIFFPHASAVQTFDFYKNEQVHYQYVASGINNAMGKVRFELNIQDPVVLDVVFTKDGKWMITYEVQFPPENLLSSKDLGYDLKFWTKNDNENDWSLITKVIDPHGVNIPITKILPAPTTINESQGILTADNEGGLKYWEYDDYQKNWCLRKLTLPNFNHFSNSVSLAWSQDGSLIFHGFDDKLQILDFETFKNFESSSGDNNIPNEFTLDSEIQAMKLVDDTNLVVATRFTLSAIDLLKGSISNSFDIYPFVNGVYKNGHLERLISCDEKTGRIALVVNQRLKDTQQRDNDTPQYKARVIVFEPSLSKRVGSFVHSNYISWIGWNHDTDFIFLDISSKLGIVGTTVNSEMLEGINSEASVETNFSNQLQKLSQQQVASTAVDGADNEDDIALDFINGDNNNKVLNMNSFVGMFENIQNVQMDTFFDCVMKVVT
ncbi:hypothetical protein ZYGR_0AS02630 [Zygosaccharomyces rouxii]|uniref:Uncharacterized protein n=1 Tax=Zygosaccharomyces rouxii TaxID=4956 RepID=A0A1Q3AH06_ZYGRO|nr:hypothetical protein ZYGR_0AS02630 [Zygosaccharomyces rouxii]